MVCHYHKLYSEANSLVYLYRRGWFSLGPRTLNELDVYLRDTYEGELIFCVVCEDVRISFFLVSSLFGY